ncbi:hypothetical protein B6D52_01760 [Candidatus Parcubacteria bacterium 4484_255]|nr:MAG: hypothetical protein B6D52_01760 [Candidatus Parcubacteria bacterium 4484_255]
MPKISKPNRNHQKFWRTSKLNKISLYRKRKSKISYRASKIFLYYSTILSTILIIGGFWTARSGKEITSNLLFLPVVIFLWITLIQKRKNKK